MRHMLLVAGSILIASAAVIAAPWSRSKPGLPGRGQDRTTASNWADERELGPYLIRSEFPLRDVQDLVSDLGELQSDLEETLGLECQPSAIQIHLFSNRRNYEQYLKIRGLEGLNRQALYVPGTDAGRIYAYRQRELEIDVRHETTHALLHSALPYVPIWIDEGLAEYFEIEAARRAAGHTHRKELQNAISSPMRLHRWRPNIERLEAMRKLNDMNGEDYRDAWGIVHFLLHGPSDAREALSVYFDEIKSGAAPTPLSQHLRQRIPNLDRAIIDHLK